MIYLYCLIIIAGSRHEVYGEVTFDDGMEYTMDFSNDVKKYNVDRNDYKNVQVAKENCHE